MIGERPVQPAAQLPRAHGRDALVDHREQRRIDVAGVAAIQLQIAAGRRIDDQRVRALLDGERADVRNRGLLRVLHVLKQRAGSADGERQLVRAEAFEVERAELIREQARGARQLEIPGRSRAQRRAAAVEILFARAFGNQELCGLESLQFRLQRVEALGFQHGEAACSQIQPCEAEALAVARDGGE